MPDSYARAYGFLWLLHEREYGTHGRAKDRERRREEAQRLDKYRKDIELLKRQGRVE